MLYKRLYNRFRKKFCHFIVFLSQNLKLTKKKHEINNVKKIIFSRFILYILKDILVDRTKIVPLDVLALVE